MSTSTEHGGQHEGLKHRTVAVQRSIETGARSPLAHFDSRRYVQHNLALGDGLGPLLEFLDALPAGSSRVTPLRAFEDGDTSFAHLEYVLAPMGHVVGFEVHRWEDGRIVEHWDNLQPVRDVPNAEGRTMTDGPVDSTDAARTGANKRRVERFVREVLIARRPDLLAEHVRPDRFAEHSPDMHAGVPAFDRVLAQEGEAPVRYDRLHRVLGEGSFCLAMSEGQVEGRHSALYDLFRLEDDRVVERWDVVQEIPPRDQWQNDNGKF